MLWASKTRFFENLDAKQYLKIIKAKAKPVMENHIDMLYLNVDASNMHLRVIIIYLGKI